MVCGMTYYQICMYFLIYSFLGWVLEVVYHAVAQGKIINRGFLNGPVCPVYAFGALGIFALVNTLESSGIMSALSAKSSQLSAMENTTAGKELVGLLVLFLLGMIVTTLIELIAGWLLYTFFHARWWDYSKVPFNFHGYICLKFSILWGIAVVIVVRFVHPFIQHTSTESIPGKWGWPVMAVLYAVYLADFIVTVATVRGLNKKLAELDRVRAAMRAPSDALSEELGKTSIKASQKISEEQAHASQVREEIKASVTEKGNAIKDNALEVGSAIKDNALGMKDNLKKAASSTKEAVVSAGSKSRDAIMNAGSRSKDTLSRQASELKKSILGHGVFGSGRLLKAFPDMVHEDYNDTLEYLRDEKEN